MNRRPPLPPLPFHHRPTEPPHIHLLRTHSHTADNRPNRELRHPIGSHTAGSQLSPLLRPPRSPSPFPQLPFRDVANPRMHSAVLQPMSNDPSGPPITHKAQFHPVDDLHWD